jgi:beta-glucanase (GH16 family)
MLALRLIVVVLLSLPLVFSFPAGPRSSASSDYEPFDSSFKLVWSDEFNQTDGSAPDPKVWNIETGGDGWGNDELEFYTDRRNNTFIEDGRLVIQALKESYQKHNYTSGRIDTQGKVHILYGLIAARARITMYDGYWPAFWLIGSQSNRVSWPRCGEMDIMEQVNGRGTGAPDNTLQFGTLHYNQYGENATQVNHEMTGSTISQKKGHYWGDESASPAPTPTFDGTSPSPDSLVMSPCTVPLCVAGFTCTRRCGATRRTRSWWTISPT